MLFFTEEKIEKLLPDLRASIWRESHEIPVFKYREEHIPDAAKIDFDDSSWEEFKIGSFWGGYDKVAWFRAQVPIPSHLKGKKLSLRFLVGPRDGGDSTAETLLFVNGKALQAIDIWHEEAWLPPEVLEGDTISISLRSWSGVLGVPDRRRFKVAQLNWIDEATEAFYGYADILLKAIRELDKNDWRRVRLLEILNNAVVKINFIKLRSEEYYASIGEAFRYIEAEIAELSKLETEKPRLIPLGHAHIDMAWLWRLRHSREKAGRTFATVLHYMRQYPEYHFMHSSPQLYQYLEEDSPEIFERVREKIASGQWEITGGMWIEPDTNLVSGEALIRQILYGKRYIREKFGQESLVLWLPDVFGYSWALPQIIKKSGMKYFMTSKLSWNQFNRFPYDTFHWRGIDGTEILTQLITTPEEGSKAFTYNGTLSPHEIKGTWDNYSGKAFNDELLVAFGWGDGGGGPTKEMIEGARVMQNLPGFPKVELGKVEPYFERLEKRVADKQLPVWDGELYLEYHRGTYTSQAETKRNNRKAEILFHELEWLSSLADILTGENNYPDLREAWELILLNQFHDILPGSSIRQVYEDSAIDYARIREIGEAALAAAEKQVVEKLRTEKEAVLVFNSLSWNRDDLIELDYHPELESSGQLIEVDGKKKLLLLASVPALGYGLLEENQPLVKQYHQSTSQLENDFYSIRFNEYGQISSIYDKENQREVLAPNSLSNVLQAFEDKPMKFDAWDIELFYQEKMYDVTKLVDAQLEETGLLRNTLRLQWKFYDSTITQRISIYAHSRRIDFRTEVDWQEAQVLLKVAFPVNIRSTRATYEIQFGNIERPTHWNTSWDYARFEVCAQRWADLSEAGYGVALLNDCKYGYDIKDNVMRLSLIKSPIQPDAQADKGRHVFTYSLFPHQGDWREGCVPQAAYELNYPLRAALVGANPDGKLASSYNFANVEDNMVMIETLKRAEDGDGWILRVYEHRGGRQTNVNVRFAQTIRKAFECNLIEEGEEAAKFEDKLLQFFIAPYEIKTFRLWF